MLVRITVAIVFESNNPKRLFAVAVLHGLYPAGLTLSQPSPSATMSSRAQPFLGHPRIETVRSDPGFDVPLGANDEKLRCIPGAGRLGNWRGGRKLTKRWVVEKTHIPGRAAIGLNACAAGFLLAARS